MSKRTHLEFLRNRLAGPILSATKREEGLRALGCLSARKSPVRLRGPSYGLEGRHSRIYYA